MNAVSFPLTTFSRPEVDVTNNVRLEALNSPSTFRDAFGRLRVSGLDVLGFGTFEYGLNSLYMETVTAGTGLLVTYTNESSLGLSTGGTASGARVAVQTRRFHRYTPGRSQLVRWTGSFGTPLAGVRQRAGYFSNRNGMFIELDGSDVYIVRRTYTSGIVADTKIPRSAWDDKFDGTGPSGLTIDFTNGTTWFAWLDLEWLGVGRYRFGFASPVTGELVTAYAYVGASKLAVPYLATANLPVRYEIENTTAVSASRTLKWVCYSVDTEGGDAGRLPLQYACSNLATAQSVANGTFKPVLALRAKTVGPESMPNRGQILLKAVQALVTGNSSCIFNVVLNPTTLTQNGGAVAWQSRGALAEFAQFSAAGDTVSGGTILDAFYAGSTATVKGFAENTVYSRIPLVYTELTSVQDTIVVTAAGIGGTSNALAAITFQEEY